MNSAFHTAARGLGSLRLPLRWVGSSFDTLLEASALVGGLLLVLPNSRGEPYCQSPAVCPIRSPLMP
jgi:hypothetical protein